MSGTARQRCIAVGREFGGLRRRSSMCTPPLGNETKSRFRQLLADFER